MKFIDDTRYMNLTVEKSYGRYATEMYEVYANVYIPTLVYTQF